MSIRTEVIEFAAEQSDEIKQLVKRLHEVSGEHKRHPVLGETALYVFWGARVWAAFRGGEPVSIHVTKLGKRKKNKFEPYCNWYGAYTVPGCRRQGLAYKLYAAAEKAAIEAGCRRVKSLAGSSAGLGLHRALRHQAWGQTPNGEVHIDSPLPFKGWEELYMPGEQPPQAPGPLMTPAQVDALIKKGLRYDK